MKCCKISMCAGLGELWSTTVNMYNANEEHKHQFNIFLCEI